MAAYGGFVAVRHFHCTHKGFVLVSVSLTHCGPCWRGRRGTIEGVSVVIKIVTILVWRTAGGIEFRSGQRFYVLLLNLVFYMT